MPWSAGTYTLPRDMTDDDSAGIPIIASNFDEQFEDIRDGINLTLTKDGQNEPTANLPMGTFRHTNVGSAAELSEYPRADQVQLNKMTFARATGPVAGAYSVTLSPSAPLADGLEVTFIASATNSASAALTVNSASSQGLFYADGVRVDPNEIVPNAIYKVAYNASALQFQLINTLFSTVTVPGITKLATTAEMSAGGASAAVVDSFTHGNIIVIDTSVTVSGFSASPTVNYRLVRHGRVVTLDLQAVSRTDGNATSMGLVGTPIPAGMRPSNTKQFPYRVESSAGNNIGLIQVTQTGSVNFLKSVIGSAFSAGDAAKGFSNGAIAWIQVN